MSGNQMELVDTNIVLNQDTPAIRIGPDRNWAGLDLRELWSYRELFYFLIWRDVKVRYKQTALGVVWVVLQPLLTALVLTVVFGKLVGMPSEGVAYPLFAFAGLAPWMFFSKALTQSGLSLVASANLITKVYFPRLIIPASSVAASLVDFGISLVVLMGLLFYYAVPLTWRIAVIPPVTLLTVLLALSLGSLLSAFNVKYRDVGAVLPLAIQIWMFATPIIYPLSLVPEKWRWLAELNPMTGLIEMYRAALFGLEFNWRALAVAAGITVAALMYSVYAFRRMERSFADVV